MTANNDSIIVDAVAEAIREYSARWLIFDNDDEAADHLEARGWIVFRDEADAEANGWVRRGP